MAKKKKSKLVADQSIRVTYKTVSDTELTLFEESINYLLDEGYELYGNPMVVFDKSRQNEQPVYTQALILKEVLNG